MKLYSFPFRFVLPQFRYNLVMEEQNVRTESCVHQLP